MQLVELQASLPALERAGIWPVALSYDHQATLAAFAAARGITYPLLADEGSAVIRRLGLLNPTYAPDHPRHGVAQPATYLLDAAGRVTRAIVHASQTVRDAWPTALHGVLPPAALDAGPVDQAQDGWLRATAALDSDHFRPRQRVGLRLRLELAPGAHVYGRPLPAGYTPLTVTVAAPEGVGIEPLAYPPARLLRLAAIDETLPVYEGTLDLATHVVFDEWRADAVVEVALAAQVCTDAECLTPRTLRLRLPIRYEQ